MSEHTSKLDTMSMSEQAVAYRMSKLAQMLRVAQETSFVVPIFKKDTKPSAEPATGQGVIDLNRSFEILLRIDPVLTELLRQTGGRQ